MSESNKEVPSVKPSERMQFVNAIIKAAGESQRPGETLPRLLAEALEFEFARGMRRGVDWACLEIQTRNPIADLAVAMRQISQLGNEADSIAPVSLDDYKRLTTYLQSLATAAIGAYDNAKANASIQQELNTKIEIAS